MTRHLAICRSFSVTATLLSLAFLLIAGSARAGERWPSSELLLPCFEVRLDGAQGVPPTLTTLFAVVNAGDEPAPIRIQVVSNWGIVISELTTELTLAPRQVLPVNLSHWLLRGQLPGRTLAAEELAHVQAALCGQRSPMDYDFYSTPMDLEPPLRLVGSIRVRTLFPHPDVLFGDLFVVAPGDSYSQGEVLANLDPAVSPKGEDDDDLCNLHAFRFLTGGGFDSGTELMVWNRSEGEPSPDPLFPGEPIPAVIDAYDESGALLATLMLELEPLQMTAVADLGLSEPFGWLQVDTLDVATFIAVRYSASGRYSVGMETFCLEREGDGGDGDGGDDGDDEEPGIRIEKATNGEDADQPPGPTIPVGSPVEWLYLVTNTGDLPLEGIEVADTDPNVVPGCDQTALEPGGSMTCRADGFAEPCQQSNVGTVVAFAPDGTAVEDEDPSHYFGEEEASIDLEKWTQDEDADLGPGPGLIVGTPITWSYHVTNAGDADLSEIQVVDDKLGQVECPSSELVPGGSMTCTAEGMATFGLYENVGEVTAITACGAVVADSDPSHYYGMADGGGEEGCTPGYWKNHLDSWPPTGLAPGDTVESLFSAAAAFPDTAAASLLEALSFGGGPTVEDKARLLIHAGVAAALNGQHPDVDYPRTFEQVVGAVDAALASGDPNQMLALQGDLDADNNLGCPLS